MPNVCAVSGCTSGSKQNPEKFHYFTAPKDVMNQWKTATKRDDLDGGSSRKVICERHFLPEQITFQRKLIGPDGTVLVHVQQAKT
ncbi:uncharacterized protein LOC135172898 [Diachasmimorpha longicaudata]|uniref:uncharacterized protein LOC135172898 n=1 Tax=Diachasmimorpha longicaudata TaxID=58733 RepID=UPI0030B871D0